MFDSWIQRPQPVEEPLPVEYHPYETARTSMPDIPNGYLIGTAPTASHYLLRLSIPRLIVNGDKVDKRPKIDFAHGNKCTFWHALGLQPQSAGDVVDWLNEANLVYADIFSSWTRRKISDTEDKHLTNIIVNVPLIEEITMRADQPPLWFNTASVFNSGGLAVHSTGASQGKVNVKKHPGSYNFFLRGLQELGFKVAIRRNHADAWTSVDQRNGQALAQFRHLEQHEIMIEGMGTTRQYPVLSAPSPSAAANLSLTNHPNCVAWRQQHGGTVVDYRCYVYAQHLNRIRQLA